jgi:hypothetical protein
MEFQSLMDPQNLGLPFVTGILVHAIRALGRPWFATPVGKRVLRVVPLLIAIPLALLGVGTAGSLGDRFMLGVISAAVSVHAYELWMKTVLGRLDALSSLRETPVPPATPAVKEPETREQPTDAP